MIPETIRCAYCGTRYRPLVPRKLCSPECDRLVRDLGRQIVLVNDALIEQVHQHAAARGAGYAATWDHLVTLALDRLEGRP